MTNKTPFLNGFPTLLFGSSKRSMQQLLAESHKIIEAEGPGELSALFSEEISPAFIESYSKNQRKRVYTDSIVFWAFLSQVLEKEGSCRRAVSLVQIWCKDIGIQVPSSNTASYVEARQRLPMGMLDAVHEEVEGSLEKMVPSNRLWRGHPVKSVDGTSVQLPDTPANQLKYPQHPKQDPGCGFPIMQLVVLLNITSTGWVQAVESKWSESELAAMNLLIQYIREDDILLADRAYSSYEMICRLQHQKAHFIRRSHQARKINFRQGKRIGPDERLLTYAKPNQPKGSCLTPEEWEALPKTIQVRIMRFQKVDRGGEKRTMYLITTLLDEKKYPREEIEELYFHRWEIEMKFKDLKTTMGMEKLRTKTPEMAKKEVKMFMIAYNLMRQLMLKAGEAEGVNYRRLSFKGTLDIVKAHSSNFKGTNQRKTTRKRRREDLFEIIASHEVIYRPGRHEPREVKTRPKSYRWLQTPRQEHPGHFKTEERPPLVLDRCA